MSKISWVCALGALLLSVSVSATDVCKNLPAPTATWLTTCNTFDVQNSAPCWSTGTVPTGDDTVLFPDDTNVTLPLTADSDFKLFQVANMIVAENANVAMAWAAFQIPAAGCLVVNGNLTMDPEAFNYSGSVSSPETTGSQYMADPSVPENTDCALLPVGFVPRICGPGMLVVGTTGRMAMRNSYASLFITTIVEEGGVMEAGEWSFIWANVTIHGTLISKSWVYMHGFVFNYGVAKFDVVVFDKWALKFVETPPIIMENHGQMSFAENTHNTETNYTAQGAPRHQRYGTYKAAVVNYGQLNFTLSESHASTYFDLFNYGTTLWNCEGDYYGVWRGGGNYINHGVFVTSNPQVHLATYYSMGGTLRTEGDSGGFMMGNGATDPRSVKLCVLSQHAPIQDPVRKALPRVRPATTTVEQRDGCWWYGSFCYQTPYIWNVPQIQMPTNGITHTDGKHSNLEKSSSSGGLMKGVSIALETAIRMAPIPQSCSRRYVFEGKSKITGTGAGSVLTTLPVAVEGTLEILNGGKWYSMTENEQPPVFGGGKVRVRASGEMYIGLDAAFTHAGTLQVDNGGLLAIPKQSKVMIANHTINVRHGAIFHVDGKLTTHANSSPLKNCGELRGRGKITKGKEEDMKC